MKLLVWRKLFGIFCFLFITFSFFFSTFFGQKLIWLSQPCTAQVFCLTRVTGGKYPSQTHKLPLSCIDISYPYFSHVVFSKSGKHTSQITQRPHPLMISKLINTIIVLSLSHYRGTTKPYTLLNLVEVTWGHVIPCYWYNNYDISKCTQWFSHGWKIAKSEWFAQGVERVQWALNLEFQYNTCRYVHQHLLISMVIQPHQVWYMPTHHNISEKNCSVSYIFLSAFKGLVEMTSSSFVLLFLCVLFPFGELVWM